MITVDITLGMGTVTTVPLQNLFTFQEYESQASRCELKPYFMGFMFVSLQIKSGKYERPIFGLWSPPT